MKNSFLNPQKLNTTGKGSVVDSVISQIQEAIMAGKFKMGTKLPNEFELMDELGVSRNSLREAMKIMSAMGIVEIKRGDGTYVCTEIKPNVTDFIVYSMLLEESNANEIIELRQTLDEDIMSIAMQKCNAENIAVLQNYIDEMAALFAMGEITRAAKLDYEFHKYMCKCCQNRFLSRMVDGIYWFFESSIEHNIRSEESFANAAIHHQKMVDCLREKDAEKIPQIIEESLSTWKINIHNSIR